MKKESVFNLKFLKKILGITLLLLVIAGCFGVFYWLGTGQNYAMHKQIQRNLIDHPEFIPTRDAVRIGSAGLETVVADIYWLQTIQYIGGNAIGAEYKAYLAAMLGLITDISPHFTYPYQIGLLLLPDVNERYETLSKEEAKKHVEEALSLGKKGISKNCDMPKLEKIRAEYNLQKLFNDPAVQNPCNDPMIPYYLAYTSYWNNNNPEEASYWYKVAGVHDTAPKGSRIMSAIMQGKTGDREKAIIMFLSLAENIDPDETSVCRKVTTELKNLLIPAFAEGRKLTPAFLQQVERARAAAKKALGEKQEEIEKTDVSAFCSSYLDKSVREMNLQYVQDADTAYFSQTGKHAVDAQELFDKKYLPWLPRDYQKGSDGYEIIYIFNQETKKWDFQMGKYGESHE